jgi:hypothetical protein
MMTIETSFAVIWENPVAVNVGRNRTLSVRGPDEALDYLLSIWPANRGCAYRDAIDACKLALFDHGSSSKARDAFVAACISARMLS